LYQNALVPELVSSSSIAYGSENFRNIALSDGFQQVNGFLQHMIDGDHGIFLLTGEEGIGKTTALRYVKYNAPDNVVVILHSFRRLDVDGVKVPMDLPPEARALRYFLKLGTIRSKGKRLLLMLDNVRELHYSGAEMLKALVNMKDKSGPLISVLLCGNPELNAFLDSSYRWGIHRLIRRNHKMTGFTPEEVPSLVDSLVKSNPELTFPLHPSALPTLIQLSEGNPGKVLKLLEGSTQIAHDHNYKAISSRMLSGVRSGKFKSLGQLSALFVIKALVFCALLLLVPITLFQDNVQRQSADIPPADVTKIVVSPAVEADTSAPVNDADEPEIVATADGIRLQEVIQGEVAETLAQPAQSKIIEPLEAMQAIFDSVNAGSAESAPTQETATETPVFNSFNLQILSRREIALRRLKLFAKPNQESAN